MNQEKQPDCILCGHSMHEELRGLTDNRFGSDGEYCIAKCSHCGLLQTIPVPDAEQLKQLYETYYNFGGEKGTSYTKFREAFFSSFVYRSWMALDGDISFYSLKGRGRLLDVGCNEGRGLTIYQRNGFDPEGLELNEKAAQQARMAGFTVHTQTLEEFRPEKPFDIVVLSNVLEHAPDPKDMLSHVARILKPGGQVWISCPNNQSWLRNLFGRFWINWHVPFHIVHFSSRTLVDMLRQAGFEVISLKQITPALWVAHSLIARLFAKPGMPTKQLRNPLLVASLLVFIRGLLFPVLSVGNRIGRGRGDCIILIAKKD